MDESRLNGNIGELLPADYRRQAGLLTVAAQSYVRAESLMRKLDMLVEELTTLSSLDKEPDEAVTGNRKRLLDDICLEREILRVTYYPFLSVANRVFSRMNGVMIPMNVQQEIEFELSSFQERLKLVEEQIVTCEGRLEQMVAEVGLLEVFLGSWLSKIDAFVQRDESVRAWVNRNSAGWSENGLGTAEIYASVREYARNTQVEEAMSGSYRDVVLMLAEATVHDAHDIVVYMCRSKSEDAETEKSVQAMMVIVTNALARAVETRQLADRFADARTFERLTGSRDAMLAALDGYLQLA
jgi:hypothetical protein